jgi:hypothetical protein
VHQVRASSSGSGPAPPRSTAPAQHLLEVDDLTVLTSWSEAAAEALAHAPERASAVLAEAGSGAGWRETLGLAEPSPKLADAIDSMSKAVRAVSPPAGKPALEAIASALRKSLTGEPELDVLVRRVLLAMIEERGTRQPAIGTGRSPRSTEGPTEAL